MKLRARVYHVKKLEAVFTAYRNKAYRESKGRVRVGYSAPYAGAVHEKVDMVLQGQPRPSGIGVYWGPHGQAKFLEQPSRLLAKDMGDYIASQVKAKVPLLRALENAGKKLLRFSQWFVPVEYGRLKASGYVRVER